MTADEVAIRLSAAVDEVAGVRLAVSRAFGPGSAAQRSRQAIRLEPGAVRLLLVAFTLPLPPLLDQVRDAVRTALSGTPWHDAVITLAVSDIDAAAFH